MARSRSPQIGRASHGDPDTVSRRRTHDWLPSAESGLAPAWNLLAGSTAESGAGPASVDTVDFGAVPSVVKTAVTNMVPKVALDGSSALTPTAEKSHFISQQRDS